MSRKTVLSRRATSDTERHHQLARQYRPVTYIEPSASASATHTPHDAVKSFFNDPSKFAAIGIPVLLVLGIAVVFGILWRGRRKRRQFQIKREDSKYEKAEEVGLDAIEHFGINDKAPALARPTSFAERRATQIGHSASFSSFKSCVSEDVQSTVVSSSVPPYESQFANPLRKQSCDSHHERSRAPSYDSRLEPELSSADPLQPSFLIPHRRTSSLPFNESAVSLSAPPLTEESRLP